MTRPPPATSAPLADDDDDELLLDDGSTDPSVGGAPPSAPWRVLVADDDAGVRTVSRLALGGISVAGAPIELVCVASAAEARDYLSRTEDVAVALLDVVMETEDAGIELARWIRAEYPQSLVRIVLRTGQPGSVPETQVMNECDIHDYLSKSETTARRLVTSVTGAIRAWADLRTIRTQRASLHRGLLAVSSLFDSSALDALPSALVAHLASLLAPRPASVVLACPPDLTGAAQAEQVVVAGTNAWAGMQGVPFGSALRDPALAELAASLRPGSLEARGNRLVYSFDLQVPARPLLAIEVESLNAFDRELVQLYCHTATLAMRNARMWELERAWLRALEKFVPGKLIALLGHESLRSVKPGDNASHDMTVCFVDVRNFTARTARVGGNASFRAMNLLFTALGEVVNAYGGIVDKYLGDGLMVLFPSGPTDALRAALEMQRRARTLPPPPGEDRLEIGIGIHTGEVVVGAVGHPGRMDISVVSPVVNLAARLQGLGTRLGCDILLTEEVRAALPASLAEQCRPLLPHVLRGDPEERVPYEAFGALSPERVEACRASLPVLTALTREAVAGRWGQVEAGLQPLDERRDPIVASLRGYARRRARS